MSDRHDGASEENDVGASAPELCAHCGDAIETSEWHPVVARSESGEFRVYPFCDDACRDDWAEK